MKLTLISVPYDSGLRGFRMGAGPDHLIAAGLPQHLRDLGHSVETRIVHSAGEPPTEIGTAFELMRAVSIEVDHAVGEGCFPIVLSGNCNIAVGTTAGLPRVTGAVWFDAHADFNTPETTASGFLDGMALAILTGRCWRGLASAIPGFIAIPETNVALVAARALDPPERSALEASSITVLPPGGALDPALEALAGLDVYLHLDPDVVDKSHGRANAFAAPNGISPDELLAAVEGIASVASIRAVGVASYDPANDVTGSIAALIQRAVGYLMGKRA